MPSWKKIAASGSDASFSSLKVDTYVSASSFSGSFTGSLFGTSSQAISSSYALTASYALFAANGGGGGISAIYIQDEGITQGTASYFNFTGAGVTATVSNSTASINIPGGGGTSNNASNAVLNQSTPATTWSFSHNLGAKYPVFTVFDSNDNVIIPQQIKAVDTASALIYFSTARTGTAVASVAGNVLTSSYSVSSSYAYTASSAETASFAFTASSANTFNVRTNLTASGLRYPTTDGTFAYQTLQTDAAGNLTFGDVQTTFDTIYNAEATTLTKGTPVYVSGSQGGNPKVYRADAAVASKMPVVYVVSENIASAATGRGITLGHIEGIDLTGYPDSTVIYAAAGGGWTSTRPTGSNVTIQLLGVVTTGGGPGGKGFVQNPGPAILPNLQSGSIWVGNSSAYPTAITTSSIQNVVSSSYAYTASSAISAYTASSAVSASLAISASYSLTSSYLNRLSQSLLPATNNTYDVGSGSLYWSNGYIKNVYADNGVNIQSGYPLAWSGNDYVDLVTNTGAPFYNRFRIILNGSSSLVMNTLGATFLNNVTAPAFSGSLFGTASQATSASYAYTASSAINATSALTASSADNFLVRNTVTASAALISGTITAQTLVVTTISSSVEYSSGSNIFGNSTANTQTMTGSLNVSGSATIIGRVTISDITGSLFGTASWATNFLTSSVTSASYAFTASSATNAFQSISSSYAFTASSATNAFQSISSSYAFTASSAINASASLIATSASYSYTASSAISAYTASSAISASLAISASYAYTASSAISSSYAYTASSAISAYTASSSVSSSLAISASYAYTASSAISAYTASSAISASLSVSASYAYTASSAINASASLIAVTSSYALTASYALNAGGGGLSALYIADEGITQGTASYINFTGAAVSATVSAGTASINITGGGSTGLTTTFTQSVAAVSWSFTHNLNTRYPLVQVYDTTFNQVNPQYVSASSVNTVIIGFGIATAGYAVASSGGTLTVTGSNVILDQTVAATTWSFTHNLNTQYPIFQVFDSNNEVMIPQRIVATDATSSLFYFPTAVTGKAVASVGGISGSAGSGVGFPFSGSAVITGSFLVSQSFVDFSKASYVTGSFTGSLFGTSSLATSASYSYTASSAINASASLIAVSASFSTFAVSASFAPGFTTRMSQSSAATTWSFTHNLNTINPIVQVYDLTNSQIVPNQIVGMNNSTAEIRFDYAQAGYAVASNGGGLYVTGSTSTLVQNVGAVTWSFNHNLNNKYNTYQVYDNNDTVIIPSGIKAVDNNNAEIYFSIAQTGRVVGQFSGINGSPNAATASYANTASFVSNLVQNVFITGSLVVTGSAAFTGSFSQNNGYVVLTQVSQSLNYADDTAAAAGGVPLGGLYRNGNFILIRLS